MQAPAEGLSLADILGHQAHPDDYNDRPLPPRSPPRATAPIPAAAAPTRDAAPAKKPSLAQRMRDAAVTKAAVSKADHALKGFFAHGASKRHQSSEPAPTLASRPSTQSAAAPAGQLPAQPSRQPFKAEQQQQQQQGSRPRAPEGLSLDTSLLGRASPPEPTTHHRRMVSDAESVAGAQLTAPVAQPGLQQILTSPVSGLMDSAPRGFKNNAEDPSSRPSTAGGDSVVLNQQQDTDHGLIDDLLGLLPAAVAQPDESSSVDLEEESGAGRANTGPGMHSITSLHDWVPGSPSTGRADLQGSSATVCHPVLQKKVQAACKMASSCPYIAFLAAGAVKHDRSGCMLN